VGNLNEYNLNLLGSCLRADITWALIYNATQGFVKILITSVGVPGHELPHGLSRGRDDAAWHAETWLEFRENWSSLPMFIGRGLCVLRHVAMLLGPVPRSFRLRSRQYVPSSLANMFLLRPRACVPPREIERAWSCQ